MKEIVVVYGGKSCEHDISIITALYIYNAINLKDYNKTLVYLYKGDFYIGKNLDELESYQKFHPKKYRKVIFSNGCIYQADKKFKCLFEVNCALLCTHGGEGENGALQGYFEVNNIPYTSSGVFASSLAMDKVATKRMLMALNYNTLAYTVISKDNPYLIEEVEEKCGYPLIIKPSKLGSSIGISVAKSRQQTVEGIELGFKYDNKLLVEKCLENFTEINCAAVKKDNEIIASLPERPMLSSGFLSYEDKYIKNTKLQNNREYPAKIDKDLTEKIQQLTKRLYEDFEMKGVVRIDYLIDKEKTIYVNEINTIPGSLSYYLFAKQSINTTRLITIMIEQAIKEKTEKQQLITSFCSNVLSYYQGSKTAPKK